MAAPADAESAAVVTSHEEAHDADVNFEPSPSAGNPFNEFPEMDSAGANPNVAPDVANPTFVLGDNPSVVPGLDENLDENPSVMPEKMTEEELDSEPSHLSRASTAVTLSATHHAVLLLLLRLLSTIEGADLALLPCSMYVLKRDLDLDLTALAKMQLVQSLCQTLSAPLWAALADRGLVSRRKIFIVGAVGQGLVTALLGFITAWQPMIFLRALNGILLASLKPVAMGVVADVTPPEGRGQVYGSLNAMVFMGMLLTTLVATPMSTAVIAGIHGWRIMFVVVGVLGVLVGVGVTLAMKEPDQEAPAEDTRTLATGAQKRCACVDELKRVLGFLKIPTFNVLILQGIFGSIGMAAGSFATMYYQYMGISSFYAGVISASGLAAIGIGMLVGGRVGDAANRKLGHHGRVLVAELTLFAGIPLKFLTFWGVEPFEGNVTWYIVLNALHGLIAVWAVTAAKLPMLSEIVPKDCRATVMAWDSAIEGSWGTLFGAPMVAFLSRAMFGFSGQDLHKEETMLDAEALGRATAVMICGPAFVSACCWALLHWSYPRDLKRIAVQEEARKPKTVDSDVVA